MAKIPSIRELSNLNPNIIDTLTTNGPNTSLADVYVDSGLSIDIVDSGYYDLYYILNLTFIWGSGSSYRNATVPLVTSIKEQGNINLDLVQNRIYATIDGNYNIKAALQWEDNANDNYYRSIIIIKKNGVLLDVQQVAVTSGVSGPIQKYSDDFDLVAGDYIELWATQDNAGGGAINVIPDLTTLAVKLNSDYYLEV